MNQNRTNTLLNKPYKSVYTPSLVTSESRGGGLGKIRKSCAKSTSENCKNSTINNDIAKRNQVFRLQKISADTLRNTTFKKGKNAGVCFCCKHRNGTGHAITVKYDLNKNKASYTNLFRCNSVWLCPVCARRVSEVRRDELLTVSEKWQAGNYSQYASEYDKEINIDNPDFTKKNSIFLVTLTVRHKRSDSLNDVLNALKHGFHSLIRNTPGRKLLAKYGIAHHVRSLEVTYGNANGWHPHFHCLFYSFFTLTEEQLQAFRDELAALWQKQFKKEWELFKPNLKNGVDVADGSYANTYVTKFGEEIPCRRLGEKVDLEMTKAHMKKAKEIDRFTPFEMLEHLEDSPYLIPRYIEYAKAFFGSKQLKYSQRLKPLMGLVELSDEEVLDELDAKEQEEQQEILTVNKALFDILYFNNLRGEFLAMIEMDIKKDGLESRFTNTNRFIKTAITQVFDHLDIALKKTDAKDLVRIQKIQDRILSCTQILQSPLGALQTGTLG